MRTRLPAGKVVAPAALALTLLGGCTYFATRFAPEKTPRPSNTAQAEKARQSFWKTFHAGNYDALPRAIERLTAAYLKNPRDPKLALLLGHAHFWKGAERRRLAEVPATITDEFLLAEKYFEEARRLAPGDDRILGWLGGVRLALGSMHDDEKLTRRGFFMLKDAAEAYPAFNHFSMGFAMSAQPAGSERFADAVEHMWQNLDACVGERLDREAPAYGAYMSAATTEGRKRVCWNGPEAPHNFEGFMLNFGDMLVKAGRPAVAQQIYANARLSKTYDSWPYRDTLEQRLVTAEERARQSAAGGTPALMVRSTFACTGCHAK